jgi:hypothetical protein
VVLCDSIVQQHQHHLGACWKYKRSQLGMVAQTCNLILGRLRQESGEVQAAWATEKGQGHSMLHTKTISQKTKDWGCSSVVGHLCSVYKVMTLTLRTHILRLNSRHTESEVLG